MTDPNKIKVKAEWSNWKQTNIQVENWKTDLFTAMKTTDWNYRANKKSEEELEKAGFKFYETVHSKSNGWSQRDKLEYAQESRHVYKKIKENIEEFAWINTKGIDFCVWRNKTEIRNGTLLVSKNVDDPNFLQDLKTTIEQYNKLRPDQNKKYIFNDEHEFPTNWIFVKIRKWMELIFKNNERKVWNLSVYWFSEPEMVDFINRKEISEVA